MRNRQSHSLGSAVGILTPELGFSVGTPGVVVVVGTPAEGITSDVGVVASVGGPTVAVGVPAVVGTPPPVGMPPPLGMPPICVMVGTGTAKSCKRRRRRRRYSSS